MAKIQLSMEELMQLVQGEVPFKEMKQQLAKALIEVWNSEEMREEVNKYGEELGRKKMERTLESAFKVTESGYYGNRKTEITGWASNLLKAQLDERGKEILMATIIPDIDRVIAERLNVAFANLLGGNK
jgi:uncharacterized membrane protein YheB (UPF0754 family)